MSGWRLGYIIMAEALKREVLKVHDTTIICTPRICVPHQDSVQFSLDLLRQVAAANCSSILCCFT